MASYIEIVPSSLITTGMIFHWPPKQANTTSGLAIVSSGNDNDAVITDDNDNDDDGDYQVNFRRNPNFEKRQASQ